MSLNKKNFWLAKTSLTLIAVMVMMTSWALSSGAEDELHDFLKSQHYLQFDMKKLPTGHDTINASIRGVNGVFVVDSGASDTVIHSGRLKKYRISETQLLESDTVSGAGGIRDVGYYSVDSVVLQRHTFDLTRVASIDLGDIFGALASSSGVRLDGIIGQDILARYRGVMDVAGSRLFLVPSKAAQPEGAANLSDQLMAMLARHHYASAPLSRLESGHQLVSATINGSEGLFVLDSGAGRSIVHNDRLSKFNIAAKDRIDARTTAGAGGFFQINRYRLDAMDIEGHTIDHQSIFTGDLEEVVNTLAGESGLLVDGVIGQDILASHQAIIDISGGRLFVLKN